MKNKILEVMKIAGELIVWLIPAFLAYFEHVFASYKANMSGAGPGLHIILMNDLTVETQKLWHLMEGVRWVFIAYPILLTIIFLLLQIRKIHIKYRIIVLICLAMPGLWYFSKMVYLTGKLITFF